MPHIALRTDLYGITSLLDFRKEAAAPLCALTQTLLRGPSTLTESERELIAAYVSHLNDCAFCHQAHAAAACMLPGGSDDILYSDIHSMQLSDKMKSLLALAGKVQQGGDKVLPEDIEAAKTCGASDLEIHDTVLIAALFCLYNRYVDGLATIAPSDPVFYEALAKRITGRGYVMPTDGYHALNVNS